MMFHADKNAEREFHLLKRAYDYALQHMTQITDDLRIKSYGVFIILVIC